MEGRNKRWARTVVVALVAGTLGYMVGPPIVQAAVQKVRIKGVARTLLTPRGPMVSGSIFSGAPALQVVDLDRPFGTILMESGSGAQMICSDFAQINGISATGDAGDVVQLTGDGDFDPTNGTEVLWEGELASTVSYTWDNHGLFTAGEVEVVAPGTANWQVYGICFDFFSPQEQERLRSRLPTP